MLIFAGYPGLVATPTYPHFFSSPQPWSNSLGDACFDLDFPSSLNANETSWVGYRDLPPQIRFFCCLVCVWCAKLCVCVSSLFVSAVPLEPSLSDQWGLRLVARLRAQQFPDKTAQFSRDGHNHLVALEPPRQKTRVATMQPVLRSPADGPHLSRLTLLAPAQFVAHFGRRGVMLGTLHQ